MALHKNPKVSKHKLCRNNEKEVQAWPKWFSVKCFFCISKVKETSRISFQRICLHTSKRHEKEITIHCKFYLITLFRSHFKNSHFPPKHFQSLRCCNNYHKGVWCFGIGASFWVKCQDFFKRRHFALSTLGDSSESEFLIIDLYLTGCTIKTYRGLEAELLGV